MNQMGAFSRAVRPLVTRCSQIQRWRGVGIHTSAVRPQEAHQEPPISRYPVPQVASLPEDLQQRIREVEEKSGFIPNVFKAYANRPDEFRAFFAFYDALMEKQSDSLTMAEKEMIVVATSAHNNCMYCVVAHSALHRIYSKDRYVADQLAINWECADLTDREKAIVKFAMGVCKSEHVADSHIEELKQHGLSDDDVWDVGAIAAFFALSNRMAHLTNMRPNTEFNIMGRVEHEKK